MKRRCPAAKEGGSMFFLLLFVAWTQAAHVSMDLFCACVGLFADDHNSKRAPACALLPSRKVRSTTQIARGIPRP